MKTSFTTKMIRVYSIRISTFIGFFDPEGFYFNPKGYDEAGGYYDDHGIYRDGDYISHEQTNPEEEQLYIDYTIQEYVDPIQAAIASATEGVEFLAVLSNLPHEATKEQVEDELKKQGIVFQKLDLKFDQWNKFKQANVRMQSKEAAKTLLDLHGKQFMGQTLKVEFPHFTLKSGFDAHSPVSLPPVSLPPVSLPPAAEPKPEKKEESKVVVKEEPKKHQEEEKKKLEPVVLQTAQPSVPLTEYEKAMADAKAEGYDVTEIVEEEQPVNVFKGRRTTKYRKKHL